MNISSCRKPVAAFTASFMFAGAALAASPEVDAIIADLESKTATCKTAAGNDTRDRAFFCVRSCQTGATYLKAVPNASVAEAKQYQTSCNTAFSRAGLAATPSEPSPAGPVPVPYPSTTQTQTPRMRTRPSSGSVTGHTDAERIPNLPEKAAYCAAKAPGMACPKSLREPASDEKRQACKAVGICQNYCSTPNLAADRASGHTFKIKQAGIKIAGCERNWEVVRKYLGDG